MFQIKTEKIILTIFLLFFTTQICSAQTTNMSVSITFTPWTRIDYPEGVYEPYAPNLVGTRRHTFNLAFNNFTAPSDSTLRCTIQKSDGTKLNLDKAVGTPTPITETLSYTLTGSDSIDKHIPWEIKNCSLINNGLVIYTTNSTYGSPLNKRIYVHGNIWTRFDSIDDDAYLASRCFIGDPKRYFNNTLYCDFAGDVGFAVAMSRGMKLEGECSDGVDGEEQNSDIDCDDIYCQGMIYSCVSHEEAQDPFYGKCRNGLCWETKDFAGRDLTYYYTRYVNPNGVLKVRIIGGYYNTNKPISYAIAGLPGFSLYGTYTKGDEHIPENEYVTKNAYALEDPKGYRGDIDLVMYVTPTNIEVEAWNLFDIYLVHMGQDLLIKGIPYYVSNLAPSNWDEKESMTGIIENPCSDNLDNDLSYSTDCLDIGCNNQYGGKNCDGGWAKCEYMVELTCGDCFDNDGNGLTDCLDRNCDGVPTGESGDTNYCEWGYEGYGSNYPENCMDGFDNDGDGLIDCYDTTACWGRGGTSVTDPCPAFESNDPTWCADGIDNDYDGKIDCMDYDCRGVMIGSKYACPYNEAYDADGNLQIMQCFDGIDNDLDNPDQLYYGPGANIDCADPDCIGFINPMDPSDKCTRTEYDPINNINLCDDGIDNDADGFTDCEDPDCYQKFDFCGPCPRYENMMYFSCSNGVDDDYDTLYGGGIDCADPDCIGEFGSLVSSQFCEISETSCFDGFDNDADGLVDCLDPDCWGSISPLGEECMENESTIEACSDGFDNDRDGRIDCADEDCWGIGSCLPGANETSFFQIPYLTDYAKVGSSTISFSHYERLHTLDDYKIHFSGTGEYKFLIITLGDATKSTEYFPFNASACTFSGSTGIRWVSTQKHVGQIQVNPKIVNPTNHLHGFNLTLTCPGNPSSNTSVYPITLTNLLDGNILETDEHSINVSVYERNTPMVVKIEPAPYKSNIVSVNFNSYFDLRAVARSESEGISQCHFKINGLEYITDSKCIFRYYNVSDDAVLSVSAAAEDGWANKGPYSPEMQVQVNVKPIKRNTDLVKVYYLSGQNMEFDADFITAESDSFQSSCTVNLYDDELSKLTSFTRTGVVNSNTLYCTTEFNLPQLADGLYYVDMHSTDVGGDTVYSDRKFFYICDNKNSSSDNFNCLKADFDNDGLADYCVLIGAVTTTSSTTTTTTLPPLNVSYPGDDEYKPCNQVCDNFYMTASNACSDNPTCALESSESFWIHDYRGDNHCFISNYEKPYCCCLLEGINISRYDTELISPLCMNGILDEGEYQIDCGGICPPCDSCYNGIKDFGEIGIDCGGPCPPCKEVSGILSQVDEPKLYIIGTPSYVLFGDSVNITIVDENTKGIQAILEVKLPTGGLIKYSTSENGRASIVSDMAGLWSVTARRKGYSPTFTVWATMPLITPEVAIVTGTSIMMPLLAVAFILLYLRRRSGVASMEEAARILYKLGKLSSYTHGIYVTEQTFEDLSDMRKYLIPVSFTDEEISKADEISIRYAVSLELAQLMLIAKKNKLEKIITSNDENIQVFNLTKIIPIWDETEDSQN